MLRAGAGAGGSEDLWNGCVGAGVLLLHWNEEVAMALDWNEELAMALDWNEEVLDALDSVSTLPPFDVGKLSADLILQGSDRENG